MAVGANIMKLQDAVHLIKDGDSVAVGGYFFYRHPMAAVHEIIRQRKKNLLLIAGLANIETDMLIGAGCVKSVWFGFISLDHLGLAPNFRRKTESGEIEHLEFGDLALIRSLEAAQRLLPATITRAWLGSDMLKYHPGKVIEVDGVKMFQTPAVSPDVAVIHAQYADNAGNVTIEGESYDGEMVKAAKKIIVTTEKVVSTSELRAMNKPFISRYHVDALVEVPYGAHPCSCYPYYIHDMRHLLQYANEADQESTFHHYLDKYVFGTKTHEEYLEAIGGKERLNKLEALSKAASSYANAL